MKKIKLSNAQVRTILSSEENPDEFKERTGRCPEGYHWDEKKSHCIRTGDEESKDKKAKGDDKEEGKDTTKDSKKTQLKDVSKDFKEISKEQKMGLATYKDIIGQREKNLSDIKSGNPEFKEVSGTVSTSTRKKIRHNMRQELNQYTNYLAGDTVNLMHGHIAMVDEILDEHAEEFSKSDASTVNEMCKEMIQNLVHQEVESNRMQFTDHGIRHVVKNTQNQQKIIGMLEEQGVKVSGREKMIGLFAMTNHDVGYTTQLVRDGGLRGIMASGEHKEYGEKIAQEQRKKWNEGKFFSSGEYDQACKLILEHDDPVLDVSDPVKLATSIADNTALFHKEKLPSMFKYVKGGDNLLMKMGKVAKAKDTKKFEKYRKVLVSRVQSSDLNANLKRDLLSATKELNPMTPKFSMGSLAGETQSIEIGKDSMITLNIKYNKKDAKLQKLFDMGQQGTKKLLEAYGVKDYSGTEFKLGKHDGKSIFKINVVK